MASLRETLPPVPRDPVDRIVLAFMCAAEPELQRDTDVPVDAIDAVALVAVSIIEQARDPAKACWLFRKQLELYLGSSTP